MIGKVDLVYITVLARILSKARGALQCIMLANSRALEYMYTIFSIRMARVEVRVSTVGE